MTYCVGILVKKGMVLICDTRTNAGLDNIAVFRKLHVLEIPGERMIAIATAGNLAVSQSVISLVTEGFGEGRTISDTSSMFETARLVGEAIRHVYNKDGAALEAQSGGFDVQMLLGGQVKGGRLRLYQLYSAGNFIEATPDTPYLQIGEHKYGKPILDRSVTFETELDEALKLGLVSMDSTMRSNLGVGMPIDFVVYRRDALETDLIHRIEQGDAYFSDLQERWSKALRAAHLAIPVPPYKADEDEAASDTAPADTS